MDGSAIPEERASDDGRSRSCPYPWCTTEHGRTLHPDDEDHRSVGISVPLLVRRTGDPGSARWTDAEIGLLRRRADDQTWLSVDDASEIGYDVSVPSLRAALRALAADPLALREILPDG